MTVFKSWFELPSLCLFMFAAVRALHLHLPSVHCSVKALWVDERLENMATEKTGPWEEGKQKWQYALRGCEGQRKRYGHIRTNYIPLGTPSWAKCSFFSSLVSYFHQLPHKILSEYWRAATTSLALYGYPSSTTACKYPVVCRLHPHSVFTHPPPLPEKTQHTDRNTPARSAFIVRGDDDHFDRDRRPQQVDHLLVSQRHGRHLANLHQPTPLSETCLPSEAVLLHLERW